MNNKYIQIFISMFSLSAFTFGGGYVIISLMQSKFVEELEWLEQDEMLNLAAIAQTAPGPVAVNASILVGYKIGGILGIFFSLLGTVLPPLIVISTIAYFYNEFKSNILISFILLAMQAGVAAVIFDVMINLGKNFFIKKDYISISIIIIAFICSYFLNINVLYIIIFSAIFGTIRSIFNNKVGIK